jgi:hypothetical protein
LLSRELDRHAFGSLADTSPSQNRRFDRFPATPKVSALTHRVSTLITDFSDRPDSLKDALLTAMFNRWNDWSLVREQSRTIHPRVAGSPGAHGKKAAPWRVFHGTPHATRKPAPQR